MAPQLRRISLGIHGPRVRWHLVAIIAVFACRPDGSPQNRRSQASSASDRFDTLRYCPKPPRFEEYAADTTFRGSPAPVDLTSDPEARRHRSVLTQGARSGPNFAGYVTVVQRGCGSPCQAQTLIDARTGRILATVTTNLGATYRRNSRLLIANPTDSSGCYVVGCAYCRPIYYEWTGRTLDSIGSGP